MATETLSGTVKFFIQDKGYGFIKPDGIWNDKDVFFHQTEATIKLEKGDTVTFQLETGARGLKAIKVQKT